MSKRDCYCEQDYEPFDRRCSNCWDKITKQRDELLEACKAAMRIESLWGPNDDPNPQFAVENAVLSDMKQKLESAIEKAEGDE